MGLGGGLTSDRDNAVMGPPATYSAALPPRGCARGGEVGPMDPSDGGGQREEGRGQRRKGGWWLKKC
jgi:hypothetical protein